MARIHYTPCPCCRDRGGDRHGDNLVNYADGGSHCFACGYHKFPVGNYRQPVKEQHDPEAPLPRDFTREVPAEAWKWLLQYGLPYSYWKPYCGYSPAESRLIITHGNPTETSVGRYIPELRLRDSEEGGVPVPRKWKQWGDKSRSATVLEPKDSSQAEGVVLVEDLISAHKVGQVWPTFPLFGVSLYPKVLQALRALKRPVTLWLDADQYTLLAPKINRLQTFLDVPVRFVKTNKDPKSYDLDEIRTTLGLRDN